MFYTVSETAELTKLSKVSIYNKIKLKELQPYIVKKQGITYVSAEGVKLINEGLNTFDDSLNIDAEESSQKAENGDCKENTDSTDIKDDYINYLKSENERLWMQVERLSRLVENGQILLREKPQPDIQMLQEHCIQTDAKIVQVKERMQEKQVEHEADHKSFWSKLFRNKKNDY